MKIQKLFAAHFPKLQRKAAAFHPQIVRKLLPGKGNVEFVSPQPLGFGGEIRHELVSGGALAHVRELFAETQVFLSKITQQVSDDPTVMGTGGGAYVQDALRSKTEP